MPCIGCAPSSTGTAHARDGRRHFSGYVQPADFMQAVHAENLQRQARTQPPPLPALPKYRPVPVLLPNSTIPNVQWGDGYTFIKTAIAGALVYMVAIAWADTLLPMIKDSGRALFPGWDPDKRRLVWALFATLTIFGLALAFREFTLYLERTYPRQTQLSGYWTQLTPAVQQQRRSAQQQQQARW